MREILADAVTAGSRRRPLHRALLGLGLLALGLAQVAEAGVNRWTTQGPVGGHSIPVLSLAVNPSDPAEIYAGLFASGTFRSGNGAGSWTSINEGLANDSVSLLVVDSSTPAAVYGLTDAGEIVRRSSAGGVWTAVPIGRPGVAVYALAVDRSAPGTVYAGSDGGTVFKSNNGGETWTAIPIGLTGDPVDSLAVAPLAPATLYATSSDGLFRSDDGGENWRDIGGALNDRVGKILAVDPSAPGTLSVSTSNLTGYRIARTTDGGESWRTLDFSSDVRSIAFLTIDPSHPSILYAARTQDGLFKSSDAGETWTRILNGPDSVYVLAIDPANTATLYAGTSSGFLKSVNGGARWAPANAGVIASQARSLAADPSAPGRLYAGTDLGLVRSDNGGGSWTVVRSDLTPTCIAVDPSAPDRIYAGSPGGWLDRSTDGGRTWTRKLEGSALSIMAVAIDPTNPAIVYAGGNGGVFKSADRGESWTAIGAGLTTFSERFVKALAVDPFAPATIYAGTGSGVFKTVDAGATWTRKAFLGVLVFAFDPSAPNTLYAGTYGNGVHKSTDGAASWIPVSTGGLEGAYVYGLAIDPSDPKTIYAGSFLGGVFKTNNGGESWSPINNGLTNTIVTALIMDPLSPGTLYAGTESAGIFDYETVDPAGVCAPDPTTLCVNGGRFKVQATWRVPLQGTRGIGIASPVTGDTGYFWFFSPDNVELVVKVVDGRAFNDFFWVFFGALSDVEYTITVTDTVTGTIRTYFNPASTLASIADTAAFHPVLKAGSIPAAAREPASGYGAGQDAGEHASQTGSARSVPSAASALDASGACVAGPSTLCLNGGRFRVQVNMRVPSQKIIGIGMAVPLTADTGYFWFFSNNNVELVIKVLDGRAVNGRFWVFYGALSNVEYTVTVTDTATGAVRTYFNPEGQLASVADTAAF